MRPTSHYPAFARSLKAARSPIPRGRKPALADLSTRGMRISLPNRAAAEGDTSDSTAQIFGCGGTLASNPPLCAGLNRHVAQLPAAQQSNPANFYQAAPANYYAQFWHANAINGLQYGFPYDDAGQSSDISISNPQYLVVAVGW